jgi:hypothetical protein
MNETDEAVVQALMLDVDRTLLRENLKLTSAQRLEKFVKVPRFTFELRHAGERMRRRAVQTAKA